MSDFNSSLPVRTENNGDIVAILCDPTTTSQQLAIDASGRIVVKLDDTAGNGITSQANGGQQALDVGVNVGGVQIDPRQIRALTSSDIVTADQGGTWTVQPGNTANTTPWLFTINQGGNSATVTASNALKVDGSAVTQPVSGTVTANQGGTWTVQPGNTANTTPWLVTDSSDGSVTGGTAASFSSLAGGQYNTALPTLTAAEQAALQLDSSGRLIIRPLTSADVVSAVQSGSWTVAATQSGTWNIGTVTSITNPVAVTQSGTWTVNSKTEDGSGTGITSTLVNAKQRLDVDLAAEGVTGSAVPFDSVQIGGSDGTNLRTLSTDTSGQLKVDLFGPTGAAFSNSNPLPVSIAASLPGTLVNKYNTTVNLAAGSSANHVYTITTSKTFTGKMFWISGSGKIRADIQTSPDGSTYTTYWTGFNSTADTNIPIQLDNMSITDSGTGSTIRIIVTNDDKQPFDVFSTISGVEN